MSIFISIASFCDPLLEFTIGQALLKAKFPQNIFFGVIDQNHAEKSLKTTAPYVRYVLIDPIQSKGACWARSLAMSLYNEEDWFFQIDSHTYFDQDWDETLISHYISLSSQYSGDFVISSYPNAFIFEDDLPVKKSVTNGALCHVVKRNLQFRDNSHALSFEAHPFDTVVPVKGFHLGAGCIFTKGSFVEKFPYDPYLYFIGEEQTMSARLFTHGWDIYHVPSMPVYHLYNNKDNNQPKRLLHWSSEVEKDRPVPWTQLEKRSAKRISDLFNHSNALGVYSLGTVRSLNQYADLSGINYITKEINAIAYTGHWKTPTIS